MKEGDKVTVEYGSIALRINGEAKYCPINVPSRHFEVLSVFCKCVKCSDGSEAHNIVIKSSVSNNTYLHSKKFCSPIEPAIKEVTMADLEEKYGCKVKIIKD